MRNQRTRRSSGFTVENAFQIVGEQMVTLLALFANDLLCHHSKLVAWCVHTGANQLSKQSAVGHPHVLLSGDLSVWAQLPSR